MKEHGGQMTRAEYLLRARLGGSFTVKARQCGKLIDVLRKMRRKEGIHNKKIHPLCVYVMSLNAIAPIEVRSKAYACLSMTTEEGVLHGRISSIPMDGPGFTAN
ncbi:MAG: hypothetical protein KKE05_00275 [Nanoarchaeota archaeon]|nr:hypothetical protein [Nanoarchaeota archaeon]